jgi:N-acetylmuramoyl-L-alanine amidase-like protein
VIRLRVFLGTAVTLATILGAFVHAQSTDPEKKKKAREEMRAVTSPTPSETPEPTAKPKPANRKSKTKKKATPTPKPKAKPTETPEPTKTPRPKKKTPAGDADEETSATPKPKASKSPGKKSGDEDEDVTPKPKAKASETSASKKSPRPEPDKSPAPKKKTEMPAKTPSPAASTPKPQPFSSPAEASPVPRPAPRPTLRPVPPQTSLPSDITVEKSGIEQEQGFEPPPPPPPVKRSWWPWSRQPSNYRYLTAVNIDAIRRAPVQRARWKFIIVHNSGTRQGSARVFDYYHRHVRRMRNGLAYHFVIGNGTSTRNGQIEIGDRWVHQMRGGHVHSDYMNNIGLGICLVGDFNRDQPTRAQLEACEELIKYLQERCGKMAVRPHREVNPPRWATDCPGDVFPYGWFGRFR